MMRQKTAAVLLVLLVSLLAGCGQDQAGQKTQDKQETEKAQDVQEIQIAAAASLKPVYEERLIPAFQKKNPGITVSGIYDSSGKLQTQIEEGLEADIFMSAAKEQMDALYGEGLIKDGTIVPLLENKIVLIVPAGDEKGFERYEDIQKAETPAIGDPESVPAGSYAKETLTNLGIWEEISEKASLGTNVTEVLNQVAEGSADAGIVYATDAENMAEAVTVIAEAPEGTLAEPVIYPVVVIKATAHEEAAKQFLEFLQTEEALQIFEAYGFTRNMNGEE